MRKKIISIMLITLMLLAFFPSTAFAATSGTCGTNAKWKLEGDTLTIYGSGAMKNYSSKSPAPWKKSAFDIEHVVIKEGITSVGKYAFADLTYVISATFAEGVKTIGSYSFANCARLNEIHIPLSLETIAEDAFYECTSLSETYYAGDKYDFMDLNIEGGNRWIITGDIFYTCDHEYPEDLTLSTEPTCHRPAKYYCLRCGEYLYIGESLPHEEEVYPGKAPTCTAPGYTESSRCLTCGGDARYRETIPPTGHTFGEWSTSGNLKTRNCTICDMTEVGGACGKTAEWRLSDGILTIYGSGSMTNYSETKLPPWFTEELVPKIKKIIIEKGITHIGDYAFAGCAFVEYIEIPKSVKTIGEFPFTYTVSLKEIFVDYQSKYFEHCNQGALYNKDGSELIWIPSAHEGAFDIWSSVTSISYEALEEARKITKFIVSYSNPAFTSGPSGSLCTHEPSTLLFYPRGTEELGTTAYVRKIASFAGALCDKATKIELLYDFELVDEYAFAYCTNVTEVVLDRSIKKIANNAFLGCDNIRKVTFQGTYEQFQSFKKKIGKEGNDALFNAESMEFTGNSCRCDNKEITVLSEATCTEGKVTRSYCPDCKSYWVDRDSFPALGHIEKIIPAKEPTCTEPGCTQGKQCERCNEIFEGMEEIPALGHKEEDIADIDPTCTQSGLQGGAKCTVCGETLKAQTEIPALGHKGEWIITKEATKTEAGTKERTCTVCGEKEVVSYNLYKTGDVNGDEKINALDATQILRYANNKSSVLTSMDESEMYGRADVTGDGKINALDATQILRYANNKSSVLTK